MTPEEIISRLQVLIGDYITTTDACNTPVEFIVRDVIEIKPGMISICATQYGGWKTSGLFFLADNTHDIVVEDNLIFIRHVNGVKVIYRGLKYRPDNPMLGLEPEHQEMRPTELPEQ